VVFRLIRVLFGSAPKLVSSKNVGGVVSLRASRPPTGRDIPDGASPLGQLLSCASPGLTPGDSTSVHPGSLQAEKWLEWMSI